jgi:8-oxo-dGTP pyrophosphatase MutT (NUDIX family)
MLQMYKVFFKDRIVFLTNNIERDLDSDFGAIFKYSNNKELSDFIYNFEKKEEVQKAYIYHHDLEDLMNNFIQCFEYIYAAGGVVENAKGELLFIHRLGVWDLPKGKAEEGESIEETALREVEEECAIAPLSIIKSLAPTFHTYRLKGKLVLKKTFWYHMKYEGNQTPKPQVEEDIFKAEWVNKSDTSKVTNETYPSIKEVLADLNVI